MAGFSHRFPEKRRYDLLLVHFFWRVKNLRIETISFVISVRLRGTNQFPLDEFSWNLRIETISFVISVRLRGTNQFPLDEFSWNFIFGYFFENLSLKLKREERKPTRCNNIDDLLSIVDCWLLTLSQHVSGIFMPIFRRKTTCYCMWSAFAGSAGCGRLRYCGATLRVWSLWRLL